VDNKLRLHAIYTRGFAGVWQPGENVAECRVTEHGYSTGKGEHGTPPADNCSCGFYAFREREQVMLHVSRDDGSPVAFGEVWLWGEVVVAEQGFRAQYSEVKSIYLPYTQWRLRDGLRLAYGMPVKLGNPWK
jgi:hypothetical protein